MTLLELCEPLFDYVCQLNRMARARRSPTMNVARADIKVMLDDIQQKARANVALAEQAKKIELPLVFFVDSMIATGKLAFAGEWKQNRLARERNELGGDDRFFQMMDVTTKDPSEEASERLAVFYTCLGLGFTGSLVGQPGRIQQYMDEIFPRITRFLQRNPNTKYCEEAYQHTDTRPLGKPPSDKILIIGGCFVVLCLSVLVIYYGMYMSASDGLRKSLIEIQNQEGGP